MRKPFVILLFILTILLIVGFVLYRNNSLLTTGNTSSRDFKIKDATSIGRIFIADRNGTIINLTRKGERWFLGNGFQADDAVVKNLIKTISNIEVINFVPKKGIETVMKEIGTQGLKVEIYDKHEHKLKSYYVGSANQSGMQTFMVLDGANIPYEVGIPGFDGSVRGSYWPLILDDFISRVMLEYPPNSIQKVIMDYPRNKNQSFSLDIEKTGSYNVRPYYETTSEAKSTVLKSEVEAFLTGFEKMWAAKVITSDKLSTDTLISDIPFLNLTVIDTKRDTNKLIIYPVIVTDKDRQHVDLNNRPFSYFVARNNGLFYSAQNSNLEKIFFGYSSFFKK